MNKLLFITLFISTAVFGFEEHGEYEEDARDQKKEQGSKQDKLKNYQEEEQPNLSQHQDDSLMQRNSYQQQPKKNEKE